MMLIELTTVPAGALPVAEFRDHLRLGSGFTDEGAEDALLEALLRAAIANVENQTGKALISRDFALTVRSWRDADAQVLPLAPATAVSRLVQIDAIETETEATSGWILAKDSHAPAVRATGACLPSVPVDGSVRIEFTAGFGAAWSDVPADIAQAVMLLAATYYEFRAESRDAAAIMPHGVMALLAPYKALRIGGGRG